MLGGDPEGESAPGLQNPASPSPALLSPWSPGVWLQVLPRAASHLDQLQVWVEGQEAAGGQRGRGPGLHPDSEERDPEEVT